MKNDQTEQEPDIIVHGTDKRPPYYAAPDEIATGMSHRAGKKTENLKRKLGRKKAQ
jgi:hypothetical protein